MTRMSAVYDCSDPHARADGLKAVLGGAIGQACGLPTDTVYGSVPTPSTRRPCGLCSSQEPGPDMPVGVLVGSWSTVDGLVLGLSQEARTLIEAFWPGDLSIVVSHAPSLHWNLGTTRGTVMLRMPLHPVALEVLREVGPMAVSSANVSGQPPASTMQEAKEQLGESVAVYLDGGPSGDPVPSTIVDLTGEKPSLLREGAVSAEAVSEALGMEIGRAQ